MLEYIFVNKMVSGEHGVYKQILTPQSYPKNNLEMPALET
jgi:hypothetical protein